MLLIRDIMYCKPGKARPMAEKFVALSKISVQKGLGAMRVMTDFSAERYMKGYHDLIDHGRREIYQIEA